MTKHTYSKAGLKLTESFEACRFIAYRDIKGVWTIGWGHTGPDVHPGMVITEAEADLLLAKDVQTAVDAVNRLVTVDITQAEFDALVDFTFNIGVRALTSSTLLRALNAGDFQAAADRFDEWDHAGGQVIAGLLRRRQAETEMFNGRGVEK
jgi:lysozyme